MKWINPKEKWPEEGSIVAVLYRHWKEHDPLSFEVMFGEVRYANDKSECFADTGDYTGYGGWGIYFRKSAYYKTDDIPVAWMLASEFILPDFLESLKKK